MSNKINMNNQNDQKVNLVDLVNKMSNYTNSHDEDWSNNPSKKGVFVNQFIHHTYPILDKNSQIQKVLDVACGNGLGVSIPLLERGLEVYSFDHLLSAINAVNINAKKNKFKTYGFVASMYQKFPIKSNIFDATFCFQAMYHGRYEQIDNTLSEINRVTKPNGYFFGTFLSHDMIKFDQDKKLHYIDIKLPNKEFKNYHKQDTEQPNLFYYLSKDFEYMVPHYYHKKTELNNQLKNYFKIIEIKKVNHGPAKFWYVQGVNKK